MEKQVKFTLVDAKKKAKICVEESAFSGVRKIAAKVAGDIELVTDQKPEIVTQMSEIEMVLAGTVGKSAILDMLEKENLIDLSKVRGKREVFGFWTIERKGVAYLVIAGSDKRGTIYGLFHISELMKVSPWVYFADVMPKKQSEVVFTEKENMVSKEPSVKYRGIFINDEWPSFGNWTFSHFGGFTAQMYDHVFELILRLKGNYLWPAMWTSNFSLDGPGFDNALLADEYGIVMSNSHHEPCLRHSEEWDLVKGEDTPYGTAWNFDRNKQGLTNYWRDGLKRNGHLENIITMGMRGERDSEILGHTATLKENIDYLKEVILTQNQLIKECVNEDLSKVPRMLALYKEVEAYFYGDEHTKGLKDWHELDGVTFMLCEDNFGNMRTLPTKDIREREGGWGMYYHFDYHGGPVSYEWVNSTYLPKVWEQMSMAYDFGIRDIWIVNTGDLKPQELPISYFMDLAYDFERFGTDAKNNTVAYTKAWVEQQFGAYMTAEDLEKTFWLIENYTRENHIRKPESLHAGVYDAVHYGEADRLIKLATDCITEATTLLHKVEGKAKRETGKPNEDSNYAAFYQLVYFPVVASMNLKLMWMYAEKNALFARQGKIIANQYANKISDCIVFDKELQKNYHSIANGKWDKLMLSEHIGFHFWNEEENSYPIRSYVQPTNKPRLLVNVGNQKAVTMGGDWTKRTLPMYDFMDPKCDTGVIELTTGSKAEVTYKVRTEADWITVSDFGDTFADEKKLTVSIDRSKLKDEVESAKLWIEAPASHVCVEVFARKQPESYAEKTFVPVLPNGVVSMEDAIGLAIEAKDFVTSNATSKGSFAVLEPFGKYESGIKAFPVTESFVPQKDAPFVTYEVELPVDGAYELTFLFAPSNPVSMENLLRMGVAWNEEPAQLYSLIGKDYLAGNTDCMEWCKAVLDNIHEVRIVKEGKKGKNTITFYACDPAVVLERILVKKTDSAWQKGYIGK